MANKKQTYRLINAIGTTAESSLVFYRAAIGAGATEGEATRLLQAYIGAMAFGKGQQAQGQAQNAADQRQGEKQA